MKNKVLAAVVFLLMALLVGCQTLQGAGQIKETEQGVEFSTNRPAKMTWKKDTTEYSYDSQKESLISKIISILTLGVVAKR